MPKFTPGKTSPAAALRPLAASELEKRVREAGEELLQLRLRKASGGVDNPARLRALRREVARCQTLLRQKRA
jgi:large subunit ribosomal protein L29